MAWIKADEPNQYFTKGNNDQWLEYHNNEVFAIFKEINYEKLNAILYDETRKLYVKLGCNTAECSMIDTSKWVNLSRGMFVNSGNTRTCDAFFLKVFFYCII